MTKKKEKIVKYLADGNIAKVGMIIYCNGNVTKITATVKENAINIWGTPQNLKKLKGYILCDNGYFVLSNSFRKATPVERKQYYAELYARNNQ